MDTCTPQTRESMRSGTAVRHAPVGPRYCVDDGALEAARGSGVPDAPASDATPAATAPALCASATVATPHPDRPSDSTAAIAPGASVRAGTKVSGCSRVGPTTGVAGPARLADCRSTVRPGATLQPRVRRGGGGVWGGAWRCEHSRFAHSPRHAGRARGCCSQAGRFLTVQSPASCGR